MENIQSREIFQDKIFQIFVGIADENTKLMILIFFERNIYIYCWHF